MKKLILTTYKKTAESINYQEQLTVVEPNEEITGAITITAHDQQPITIEIEDLKKIITLFE